MMMMLVRAGVAVRGYVVVVVVGGVIGISVWVGLSLGVGCLQPML